MYFVKPFLITENIVNLLWTSLGGYAGCTQESEVLLRRSKRLVWNEHDVQSIIIIVYFRSSDLSVISFGIQHECMTCN